MQSSAIQFVIGMEIERQKRGRKKKPSYILCYWLAFLSASLLTCTYMLMPVARVCVCVYVLSVPFQYSPDKSGLHTQSNLDLIGSISMPKVATSISCSINHATCKAGTYIHTGIHIYIHMYICMYAVPTLGTLM